MVPSLLIISQFTAIAAVALSNITILASAIANLIFNVPRKSVLRPGPLIDWDLVLLFGPPTVMGSIAGSYINMVIPSWCVANASSLSVDEHFDSVSVDVGSLRT